MKVFDRPFFQKGRGDLGQSPKSRPQARDYLGVSFDSFLCASGVKEKNGIGLLT